VARRGRATEAEVSAKTAHLVMAGLPERSVSSSKRPRSNNWRKLSSDTMARLGPLWRSQQDGGEVPPLLNHAWAHRDNCERSVAAPTKTANKTTNKTMSTPLELDEF